MDKPVGAFFGHRVVPRVQFRTGRGSIPDLRRKPCFGWGNSAVHFSGAYGCGFGHGDKLADKGASIGLTVGSEMQSGSAYFTNTCVVSPCHRGLMHGSLL